MRALAPILVFVLSASVCLRAADTETNKVVELEGRVLPVRGSTNLQFRTDSGKFKLLYTREGRALFADTNLHAKVLLLKGRVRPKEKAFEVTGNLHSIRDGKVYEVYYYCDICAVAASGPGPCVCCREPVVLTEKEK